MKTLIYATLFCLTLNTLSAQEAQPLEEATNQSSEYQLNMKNLAYADTDQSTPETTLDVMTPDKKMKNKTRLLFMLKGSTVTW